jgi:hypothetical protein
MLIVLILQQISLLVFTVVISAAWAQRYSAGLLTCAHHRFVYQWGQWPFVTSFSLALISTFVQMIVVGPESTQICFYAALFLNVSITGCVTLTAFEKRWLERNRLLSFAYMVRKYGADEKKLTIHRCGNNNQIPFPIAWFEEQLPLTKAQRDAQELAADEVELRALVEKLITDFYSQQSSFTWYNQKVDTAGQGVKMTLLAKQFYEKQ